MLPKNNRADRKAVEKIFKDGFFVGSNSLNLKYIVSNNITPPQISFVVPKTVEKRAVKRNSLRRSGYLVIERYLSKIPKGFSGVFLFNKTKEIEKTPEIIENDIKVIFSKLKCVKKD